MCSATRCLATLLAICQVLFAQLAWCGDFVCKLPNFPPKQNPQNPSAYNGKAFLGSKARQQSAKLQQSRIH